MAALVLGVGAVALWNVYPRLSPTAGVVSEEKAALPLPDEPSIAVLPFANMSADPAQEYFSDGLTDALITQLYKIPNLFVIARTSSATYKGKAVKVQQVGRELGVRWVLEGSVQKAGERVRIQAQLIEAATGKHVWAESYDRELKDVFAVQDSILRSVVTELGVKLAWGEEFRSWVHATENLQAFDYFMQADKLYMRFEKEANAQARELLIKAIELDPKFARAIAFLGATHVSDTFYGWAKDPAQSSKQAEDLANRALAIDDRDYLAHALLSRIYAQKGLHEQAIASGQRAVEVEPSNATAVSSLAGTMTFAGRPEEGLALIRKAMRLNPYPPLYYLPTAVYASYLTGRYEAAIIEQAVEGRRAAQAYRVANLSHGYLLAGRTEEAVRFAERAHALSCDHKERGNEAWAFRLLGEIAAHQDPPEVEKADDHYRQAMALAEELGMRPLLAHCHLGLGKLYRPVGKRQEAREHLTTAATMLHDMDMRFWLARAEAELAALG